MFPYCYLNLSMVYLLHLVRILLVCPITTAHVECQFSYIKRFLGDWRVNLGRNAVEHLLRICKEGPKPLLCSTWNTSFCGALNSRR